VTKSKPRNEPATLPEHFMTPTELADLLGIPVGTLYYWRHVGKGPAAFKAGRHVRYDPKEIARWVADQKQQDTERIA
jgi:excisionase family DNA binding protein